MTLTIDLTPNEEARIEASARQNGIAPVDVVKKLVNEYLPPVAPVRALLTQWQQQYGLPPRPDGKVHSSFQDLLQQWEDEDSLLTPEEVAAQSRLWDGWQLDKEPLAI